MKKKKYYGVTGTNGYGVYNDYTKVMLSKPYIKKYKVKSFGTFIEARNYAIETHHILQNISKPFFIVEENKKLNWFHRK